MLLPNNVYYFVMFWLRNKIGVTLFFLSGILFIRLTPYPFLYVVGIPTNFRAAVIILSFVKAPLIIPFFK